MIVRVVLDTNTLVSGVMSAGGPPRRLIDAARMQVIQVCSSPVLLAELLEVLSREKFAARLTRAGLTPRAVVSDVRRIVRMIVPAGVPRVVASDPDDDHVLACAVAGHADLIVTGDKDLHSLGGHYSDIPIVTPAEAVSIVDDLLAGRP